VIGRPSGSVLVRGGDGLRKRELGRSWGRADLPDEGLQLRVREELLEVFDALPFVVDHDEAVADPEPVVDAA
jgi:hypothetical protein